MGPFWLHPLGTLVSSYGIPTQVYQIDILLLLLDSVKFGILPFFSKAKN